MALPKGDNPTLDGVWFRPAVLTADNAENDPAVAGTNVIPANCKSVDVTGVTNDANDFVVLPALSTVPNGHTITLLCNAGGNFELRTPASSNEKINTVDSDGSQEYLCTDTDVIFLTKVSNTDGWMAYEYDKLGAVVTAVVPD